MAHSHHWYFYSVAILLPRALPHQPRASAALGHAGWLGTAWAPNLPGFGVLSGKRHAIFERRHFGHERNGCSH